MLRFCLCIFFAIAGVKLQAQDSTQPWFPGDDPAFYRYLEIRLTALGSQKPAIEKTGEQVIFEFYVTDSGYVDSVQIGQCFNFQLCYQLRQILNTMPRVNANVEMGKTVAHRRVYVLDIRYFRDGYAIEPSPYVPTSSTVPSKFKWAIAVVAAVAMLIAIFK